MIARSENYKLELLFCVGFHISKNYFKP